MGDGDWVLKRVTREGLWRKGGSWRDLVPRGGRKPALLLPGLPPLSSLLCPSVT